ncbi:MAG TPA: outer membrane protein assembly factor BamD [Patescibacteria group bacterium]|nr:outer membrane protein assembly factor BamD [Patescibacteria group bacterium]
MPSLHRARAVCLAVAVVASLSFLGGCGDDANKDTYKERPVEILYNEAIDLLNQEEYTLAAKAFDEVERQHPYSVWATKAQLMAAYAQYQRNKFDEAVIALDRFIQLHPSHKDVAYAYYLKALCYYEQIADVTRDQKMTDQAMKALQEVVDRFPNSKFARDAKLKIDLARDHMAGKEMAVGRYYLRQKQYLAAINRFRVVVDNYQTTTHVPEAMHRLIECYEALGLKDEAKRTAAVLGFNYPGNEWYSDSYGLVKGDLPKDQQLEEPKSSSGWFSWLW